MTASSPKGLAVAIDTLLEVLQEELRRLAFQINWARGKTEMQIAMRGKNARRVFADRIAKHDGDDVWLLPDGCGFVHVVDAYKHVGTKFSVDGSMMPEIIARCSAAMTSYAPICTRVLGSQLLGVQVRIRLAFSLVLSRLLHHAGLWSPLAQKEMVKLSKTYMTVMRRIHGSVRGSGGWKVPDVQVLADLGLPMVDDLLAMRRLHFLEKVLNSSPPSLCLLLGTRGRGGCRMSWAKAVLGDMQQMRARLPNHLAELGDPSSSSQKWLDLIRTYPRDWKELVRRAFCRPPDPASKKRKVEPEICRTVPESQHKFGCTMFGCTATFSTNKAARQHERVVHGCRSPVEQYVGADCRCPVCHKQFGTRWRAIAHLSDPRVRNKSGKPSCRDAVLSGQIAPVHGFDLCVLRNIDKALRKDAVKAGHSHAVVGFGGHANAPAQCQLQQRPRFRLKRKSTLNHSNSKWAKAARHEGQ